MSSQNKKKSWTFVPERSRAPPNKRATRRKTTLRAFTFVQDWDPRISPIPSSVNNASQKKTSHKKSRNQPTSSQSSESSIRESPIAQLVRSSPGPIIVARRIPGSRDKSFRSPHPLSPSTSISSQNSSSSRQKSASKSPGGSVQTFSRETGVGPAFSVPRTRGKQHSGSKDKSTVLQVEETTSSSPGVNESGKENLVQDANIVSSSDVSGAASIRLQESIIDSVESSGEGKLRSTAKKNKRQGGRPSETPNDVNKSQSPGSERSTRSTRSRKRRGPSLTFQKKSSKGRTSLSVEDKKKSSNVLDSIDETIPWDDERRELSHVSSGSDDDRQATSPRTKQGSNLTSKKESAKGKTIQTSRKDDSDSTEVPVESDVPTPGSVTVSQRASTSSNRSRSTSSRRKRGPILTFKKKAGKRPISTPQDGVLSTDQNVSSSSSSSSRTGSKRKLSSKSSESEISSPEAVVRRKSSSDGGQKSGESSARTPKERPVSKKKNATSKIRSKELAKTPDRSMSFITTTPKSGHVVRRQPKTQQGQGSGPVKEKGLAGQRKRGTATESSEPEEPAEKRAKVRLYTTGARPRLVGDTTDLDILFNCLEDTAIEFREALDAPRNKKAVTKFIDQARHELTDMISMQHDFKLQTLSLSRTNSSIRKYRNILLNLQRENTRLDVRIAEIKKKKENSEDIQAMALKEIDSFVSDLKNLHKAYVSKYPKDIKSVEYVAHDDVETVSSQLKPTLELTETTGSLSNKLGEWLGSQ